MKIYQFFQLYRPLLTSAYITEEYDITRIRSPLDDRFLVIDENDKIIGFGNSNDNDNDFTRYDSDQKSHRDAVRWIKDVIYSIKKTAEETLGEADNAIYEIRQGWRPLGRQLI